MNTERCVRSGCLETESKGFPWAACPSLLQCLLHHSVYSMTAASSRPAGRICVGAGTKNAAKNVRITCSDHSAAGQCSDKRIFSWSFARETMCMHLSQCSRERGGRISELEARHFQFQARWGFIVRPDSVDNRPVRRGRQWCHFRVRFPPRCDQINRNAACSGRHTDLC